MAYEIPEYGSQDYLENLGTGYWAGAEPELAKGQARLAASLAGTGMARSTALPQQYLEQFELPAQAGWQRLLSSELGNIGQWQAEVPFREAALTGMYGGAQTMAGQELASNLASAAIQQQYQPQMYESQLAGEAIQQQYQPQLYASQLAGEAIQQQYQPQLYESQLASQALQQQYQPQMWESQLGQAALEQEYYPYQYTQMTPYQQASVEAAQQAQEAEMWKNLVSVAGSTGLLGAAGGAVGDVAGDVWDYFF